jgi:FtsH-binding integral membrane protein
MALTAAVAQPLLHAPPAARAAYLRRVTALTFVGLTVASVVGFVSALIIAFVPILQSRWISLAGILGSYFVAQFVARKMVFSSNAGTRMLGFGTGVVFEGISMGWLLLAAVVLSASALGDPMLLIGEALGLTLLTAAGMTAYVWVFPQKFSWLGAGLSMMFLPMLVLMGISFVFPIGGIFGIGIAALFVVVSAGGLLYQLNLVINQMRTDMHIQGAFLITMGILILFWNILVLLMKLNRR